MLLVFFRPNLELAPARSLLQGRALQLALDTTPLLIRTLAREDPL